MGKRRTQWVGGAKSYEPQTDASTSASDVIQLVEPRPLTDTQGLPVKCTIEAIYLHFSIKRILITDFDALGFLVYTQQVSETSDLPLQALDALSLAERAYANKQILMMAPLPYPPIFLSSDLLSATPDNSGMVASHEFQASRKLDRSSQVLCMTLNSDVSVVVNVFAQWRILLSYGR